MPARQPLRKADEPFYIPWPDTPRILPKSTLEAITSRATKKIWHQWYRPTLQLQQLHAQEMVWSNSFQKEVFTLRLSTDERQLGIACSCGQPVTGLCVHAYAALFILMGYEGEVDFNPFLPGGHAWLAFQHPGVFEQTVSGLTYQLLHAPHRQVYQVQFPDLQPRLPAPSGFAYPAMAGQPALAFLLVHRYRRPVIPFLMPCLVVPAGQPGKIRKCLPLAEALSPEAMAQYSAAQQALISHCRAMLPLAEARYRLPVAAASNGWQAEDANIFEHWQQLWPLLCQQPLVFSLPIYAIRDLKKAPSHRRLTPVVPIALPPQCRWQLSSHPDHFRLHLRLTGTHVSADKPVIPFHGFVQQGIFLQLCRHVGEAELFAHMEAAAPFLTILPAQMETFRSRLLEPIRRYYPVDTNRSSGR